MNWASFTNDPLQLWYQRPVQTRPWRTGARVGHSQTDRGDAEPVGYMRDFASAALGMRVP